MANHVDEIVTPDYKKERMEQHKNEEIETQNYPKDQRYQY
jgi:hypothetical protein